eukprot:gene3989-7945_t
MNSSADNLVQWCLSKGIVMARKPSPDINHNDVSPNVTHAPFSMSPYDFPGDAFADSIALAPLFGRLIDVISQDFDWLNETLFQTAQSDSFTSELIKIFRETSGTGIRKQSITLSINRSDYMLHDRPNDSRKLLQVELNTIAASFGALSTKISEMHAAFYSHSLSTQESLPSNKALNEIAAGLAAAHGAYIKQTRVDLSDGHEHEHGQSVSVANVCILFVVQAGERNFSDQKHIQYELWERYTLSDLNAVASLSPTGNGTLLIRHPDSEELWEVSVVYFRAGYGPEDYQPSAQCWASRLLLEQSMAIKCPTVAHQLVGTKKVQQALAMAGELEKFVTDVNDLQAMRKVFAGLYSLEGMAGDKAVAMALADPDNFVLKPQREGGGHNFYGQDVADQLRAMNEYERSAYILMERIRPPDRTSILVRDGQTIEMSCLCELGVYGIYLRVGDEILINKYGGHLLRVKPSNVDEGGVAAGFAVLSSPKLIH